MNPEESLSEASSEPCYLYHCKQSDDYSCFWHAAYAVTGDEKCLEKEYKEEGNFFRKKALLSKLGWIDDVIWQRGLGDSLKMSEEDWELLIPELIDANPVKDPFGKFIAAIHSRSVPHSVGLVVGNEFIQVSDSIYDQINTFNL